jgi:predicted DNA-binding transcriptional regulator YafY
MKLTKDELRALYESNKVADAAATLGVSAKTFFLYINKAGIPHKGHRGRKLKIEIVG